MNTCVRLRARAVGCQTRFRWIDSRVRIPGSAKTKNRTLGEPLLEKRWLQMGVRPLPKAHVPPRRRTRRAVQVTGMETGSPGLRKSQRPSSWTNSRLSCSGSTSGDKRPRTRSPGLCGLHELKLHWPVPLHPCTDVCL